MAAKRVSVVVLTYNNYRETLRCLRALTRISYRNVEFVFVDNGSTNEAVSRLCEELRTKHIDFQVLEEGEAHDSSSVPERTIVIRADANRGYAAGNNIGIRVALARGADYVLVLNNDTVPEPGFLEPLVEYAESHRHVAAVGPRVLDPDGGTSPVTARRRPSPGYFAFGLGVGLALFPNNRFERQHYFPPDYMTDRPLLVDILPGCCMMLRSEALLRIGPLDESTFLYWEEHILAERLNNAGYASAVVPASRVTHRHGRSSSLLPPRFIRRAERRSLHYYLRHYRFHNPALAQVLTLMSYNPRYLLDDLTGLASETWARLRSPLPGRLGCRWPAKGPASERRMAGEPSEPTSSPQVIVHAADFSSAYGGNFLASLRALADDGRRTGREFVLAFPESACEREWFLQLSADGYRTAILPEGGSVLRGARALHRLCESTNAALVHTHFSSYDVAAWLVQRSLTGRNRRLGVVWHAHSSFPAIPTPARAVRNMIKYRLMGRTAQVIAVSDHVRRETIARGLDARRVIIVNNGIDLTRATAANRTRDEVLEQSSIPGSAQLVLLFGWEPIVKGVDTAIEAVGILADAHPRLVLGVVGTERLHEFTSEQTGERLPHWLVLLPPVERVADYYAAATIFLSASRSEGFPYSICEAMANGLPVVLSDIPGTDWARGAPGALFFQSGNASDLAKALEQALGWTDAQREECGRSNRPWVASRYGVARWVKRVQLMYDVIIGPA